MLRTRAGYGHEDGATALVTEGGCVGYELRDPLGRRVGLVEKIFSDSGGRPTYVGVRKGYFGRESLLIPVRAIAVDDEQRTIVLR